MDYSLAIELNPLQYEYWTNRGLAFESMAEDLLEREAADNAGQDGGGGRASHQLYEAAVENYQHAMVLDPENHRCGFWCFAFLFGGGVADLGMYMMPCMRVHASVHLCGRVGDNSSPPPPPTPKPTQGSTPTPGTC